MDLSSSRKSYLLAGSVVAASVALGVTLLIRRRRKSIMHVLSLRDEQELDQAIMEAEKGNVVPLTLWWRAFRRGGHVELMIAKDEVDAHCGRVRSNSGSPLYRAAVIDAPVAVGHLIALGDDVNYSHPSHGDGPLLHCAQQGYDECLAKCLEAPNLEPDRARTVDVRRFLGQGTPLYDEGGLSPLALAARSGRVSTVQVILRHPAGRSWLQAHDSFDRGLVSATCVQLSYESGGSAWKQEQLTQILYALCAAEGTDAEAALRAAPSKDEAEAAERRRQREVRARCLKREKARDAEARERGLAEVMRVYRPTHPSVYKPHPSSHDVFVHEGPQLTSVVKEPIPGVLVFPLLSPDLCRRAWEELYAYERAAASDHNLPLHVRHDGNLSSLEALGFEPFLKAVEHAVAPVIAARLPSFGRCEVYHAFVTRNYVGRASNATFKMHCDKSALTINVCLHASADVEGSTVGFYVAPADGSAPTDPQHRLYTHTHVVGHAVVHDGSQWHKTDPILRGTRGSLIIWARRATDSERPQVGDLVRLADNPRVATGVLAGGALGELKADDGVSRQPFEVRELHGPTTTFYHTTDLVVVQSGCGDSRAESRAKAPAAAEAAAKKQAVAEPAKAEQSQKAAPLAVEQGTMGAKRVAAESKARAGAAKQTAARDKAVQELEKSGAASEKLVATRLVPKQAAGQGAANKDTKAAAKAESNVSSNPLLKDYLDWRQTRTVNERAAGAEERFGTGNPTSIATRLKATDGNPSVSAIFNEELRHWKDELKKSPLGKIKMPEIKMANPFRKESGTRAAPTSSGKK